MSMGSARILEANYMPDNGRVTWQDKPWMKQVTWRGTIVGLIIGTLVLISNFQFGLQTGWVSMMSMPSALLAYAFFNQVWTVIAPDDPPFNDVETVYVQSIAVAVGTGPLAFGFVGVIPAIEKFVTFEESGGLRQQGEPFTYQQLLLWSLALALFGIFFAVPLRKQAIVKEKLSFPSGSATATLISVLSGTEILQEVSKNDVLQMRRKRLNDCPEVLSSYRSRRSPMTQSLNNDETAPLTLTDEIDPLDTRATTVQTESSYSSNIRILIKTFSVSAVYTITSYFFPMLKSLPIFGTYLNDHYLWNFQPSPAYVGQGMIMGIATVSYMLIGCILGWGVLGPLALHKGWVDPNSDVHDWEKGIQGWILWCSLSIMVADSLVSFIVITVKSIVKFIMVDDKAGLLNSLIDDSFDSMLLEEETHINNSRRNTSVGGRYDTIKLVNRDHEHEVESKFLVNCTTVVSGVIISTIMCVILIVFLFGREIIPIYAIIMALTLAFFLSILAIRALGETDLNPVSGIGKISQMIFAMIIPRTNKSAILINLVAGGITEAGAQQAGDLMQDLKTGHLLGASPKAQFIAQLIGAMWSILMSVLMYICYNKVYDIPNKQFRIPTAVVWIDCARLVTGKELPEHALECAMIFGCIFGIMSFVKNCLRSYDLPWLIYIPSGIAVGVGIFNTPSFTIARFIGGLVAHVWLKRTNGDFDAKTQMIVFSSGLVLGEGVCSIIAMIFTSLNVPHL